MTKQQKKDVRRGLRRYGRAMEAAEGTPDELTQAWGRAIGQALYYYAEADPVCAELCGCDTLRGETSGMWWAHCMWDGRPTTARSWNRFPPWQYMQRGQG